MAEPTCSCPDRDAFCVIDRLVLTVTGQLVAAGHTVLACQVMEPEEVTARSAR